jgi:hypothetical protein
MNSYDMPAHREVPSHDPHTPAIPATQMTPSNPAPAPGPSPLKSHATPTPRKRKKPFAL